jgi:hypothetical protein
MKFRNSGWFDLAQCAISPKGIEDNPSMKPDARIKGGQMVLFAVLVVGARVQL